MPPLQIPRLSMPPAHPSLTSLLFPLLKSLRRETWVGFGVRQMNLDPNSFHH